jgi:hypothetical protein
MQQEEPRTGPRHEPDRIYERASDPAEAADKPLEPKSSHDPLAARDEPGPQSEPDADPHHSLNNPVGTPNPDADSDPYSPETPDDDADRASGVRGSGHRTQDG